MERGHQNRPIAPRQAINLTLIIPGDHSGFQPFNARCASESPRSTGKYYPFSSMDRLHQQKARQQIIHRQNK
jgi:hypothetical protein